MGVANNTRKIFMGGKRGKAPKAPKTKKAPTPPKKAPTAAKKAKTNAKQAARQKEKTKKAAANKKAGLKRQAEAKKEKAAGTFKRKSKSEKKANKAAKKTAKKTAKKAAQKKPPTRKKKNSKKGSSAPSILGGPLGALGDAFKALTAGLAAAAEAAAAAAAALADALSDMFNGASDMGEGFGAGASSGANITGSNSNGNCSPEALNVKSAADAARSKALEDYDPEKSGSLDKLVAADKVWKAAMKNAKITGTCEGDSTKNAENSPKNSPKEPEPSIATAKDMDDNTFAKAWAGSESILGLVPPIKSTDKFKPIQERIMKKIKTKSSDSDEHIQARKEMYIAMRFILDPANIHRKFRKPSVLNAKVGAQANAKNSGPVNSSNNQKPVEPNTNSKYMTQEELNNLRKKSIEFINTAKTLEKINDNASKKIIQEIPAEELNKMDDNSLANYIKGELYKLGVDDNDKIWPDNFSKFWADAEYILGFKIKESDTYYDIQKKVSLRREMFSNEIYEKIKYAISGAELFITEHHYFFRKFRKEMYVGDYKNTIHKTKEQIKKEMSYLKGPPPQS